MKFFSSARKIRDAIQKYFGLKIFGAIVAVAITIYSANFVGAAAGVPMLINFQGRLMNSSGDLLGTAGGTDYCYKFSIWDATTGGSKIWPSGAPSRDTITTRLGVFDATIGEADTLDLTFTDDQAFVEVEVATMVGPDCTDTGGAETFETLSPRPQIVSSGFAINSKTVGGFTPAQSATNSQIPVLTSGAIVLSHATTAGLQSTGANALTIDAGTSGVLNLNNNSSGNILLGGGSSSTGCTLTNSNGNFACAGTISAPTINGTTALQLNGTDINTAGTLTNVAYLNQANAFTNTNGITVQSATAFTVTRTGTNYAFQVDTNTASSATGLKITAAAAAGGVALAAISSGTDENLTLDAKGSGVVNIGGTSTGNVALAGGSGGTGCTVTNTTGAFACTAGGSFTSGTFTPAGANQVTITNATASNTGGLLGVTTTSSSNFVPGINNTYTQTATGSLNAAYGIQNTMTSTAVVAGASVGQSLYGIYNIVSKTGADTATGTYYTFGEYTDVTNTGRTNAGTVNTYGGYFAATGDTAGTSTAYGLYVAAAGADSNYALITGGGNVGIGDSTPTNVLTVTGTASISSVLQVGQETVAAYSRLGAGTTGHSLGAADDLLITDDLEVDGDAFFDGTITNPSLTATRVTFAGTGGLLVDDADLTFATDTLSATKLLSSTSVSTPSLISTGAVTITPASGSNLNISLATTGDFAVNTNDLYVDTSTSFVGIGTTGPTSSITWGTNGSLLDVSAVGQAGSAGVAFHAGSAGQETAFGLASGGGFYMDVAGHSTAASNFLAFRTEETSSQYTPTERWRITSAGDFIAGSDNAYDIGASGATRPRTGYFGTSVITPSATVSGLTATRVTFAGTGGLLVDDAGFTFTAASDQLQLGSAGTDGSLKIFSEDGGTDHSTIFNPGIQTQDIVYTLPVNDGDASQVLTTDGAGVLSWTTASGGTTWNGISAPTGTQSLTFDDGELNAWTVSSDTETFQTITANSLTTGKIFSLASSSLTSGTMIDIAITGTGGLTNQKGINVSTTGAITGTQTTYGGYFSNTHSGGTSTNVGLYSTASGGTNNYAAIFDSGNVGIGETTPDAKLHIVGSTTASGATAIAGTLSELTLTNSTGSGFQYGNRLIATVNGATAGTEVGQFIRMIDNTSLNSGQNVRGLEVQAFSGTNVNGINTGIATFGYTFGLQATTTAQAAAQAAPAAIFADLDNGTDATTKARGNAIRAYTDNATSATLVQFYQETSAFTGTGLQMDFGNNSGSFIGNFLDFKYQGSSKFISAYSSSTSKLTETYGATGSIIDYASSTAGGTFVWKIPQEATTNTCASAAAEGIIFQNTGGTQVGHICISGPSAGAANKLHFFAEGFNATSTDLAENYSDAKNVLEPGDVVMQDSSVKYGVKKTNEAYAGNMVGVVSTSPGLLLSGISESEGGKTDLVNPKPVALSGRVPVKISNENGEIKHGDHLTSSETMPGYAMKMTEPGNSIGIALEDSTPDSEKVDVFVNLGYKFIFPDLSLDEESEEGLLESITDFSPNSFFGGMFGRMTAWLGDAKNGIGDFFANRVRTTELCVKNDSGETCITREQLDQILDGGARASVIHYSGGGGGGTTTTTSSDSASEAPSGETITTDSGAEPEAAPVSEAPAPSEDSTGSEEAGSDELSF